MSELTTNLGDLARVVTVNSDSTVSGTAPSQFDSSAKFATTAFVQKALGGFSQTINASSGVTLTASQVGAVVYGGSSQTVTLPLVSSVPEGATFFIAAAGTVATQGADVLYNTTGSSLGNSYITGTSAAIPAPAFILKNGGVWQLLMGSSALKADTLFASSLTGNGYQKLPSGTILQWGTATATGNSSTTVTLPITFPNAALHVVAMAQATGNSSTPVSGGWQGISTSQFTFRNLSTAGSTGFSYIAIGY